MKYSIVVPVYHKEKPEFFDKCLRSLVDQTRSADEIIIVKDGPVGVALESVISSYKQARADLFKVIELEKSYGGGWKSYSIGMHAAKNELIGRADSDDISYLDRFEKQISAFESRPDVDVVSCWINEFNDNPEVIINTRKVPKHDQEIKQRMKKKNPMNHNAVMYKSSKVIKAGDYERSIGFADYNLWARMANKNMVFYNIQEPLLYARVGNDLIGRRAGYKYAKAEFSQFRLMYDLNILNVWEFIIYGLPRIACRFLPKRILGFIYNFR